MVEHYLTRVAEVCSRHPLGVVAGCLAVTLVCGVLAAGLPIENDFISYLPQDSPVVQTFQRTVEAFGTSDSLVVVMEIPPDSDLEPIETYADYLAEELGTTDLVRAIDYRFEANLAELNESVWWRYALLYLDEQELLKLEQRLSDDAIREQVALNRERLATPIGSAAKEAILQDPLDLRGLFQDRLAPIRGHLRFSFTDGYYFSQDHEVLLMIVRPVRPAVDVQFAYRLLDATTEAIERARELAIEDYGDTPELEAVQVGLTGGYAISVAYDRVLKRDIAITLVTAFTAVMLLYVLAFRRWAALFYVGLPLLASLCWTLGLVRLVFGSLNLFTGSSAAVLVGLGVDFSIHLFNRYEHELRRGRDFRHALRLSLGESGSGILLAALTTAAAFYSPLVSGFRGLLELGFICGTGILLCMVATFTLTPALLVLAERWGADRTRPAMWDFGTGRTAALVQSHPTTILVATVIATAVLGAFASQARFDDNMTRLRPTDPETERLQRLIVDKIGSPLMFSMALTEAEDSESALEQAAAVLRALQPLQDAHQLQSVQSLAHFIPAPSQQRRSLAWLHERGDSHPEAWNPERVRQSLAGALADNGFRVDDRSLQFVEWLEKAVSVDSPLGLEDLRASGISRFVDRFVQPHGDGYDVVAYAYTRTQAEMGGAIEAMDAALAELPFPAQVMGVKVLSNELRIRVKRAGLISALVALTGVSLMLYVNFRRIRYVVLTTIPLLMGIIWGVGLMVMLGIDFNFVSAGMVAIIIGIGIDDGIHIVHRFLAPGWTELEQLYHQTGRAVVITSLTTIVAFGSLVFADYPGLVGAGILVMLGVGGCLLTAVLVLPALLVLLGRRNKLPPGRGRAAHGAAPGRRL